MFENSLCNAGKLTFNKPSFDNANLNDLLDDFYFNRANLKLCYYPSFGFFAVHTHAN